MTVDPTVLPGLFILLAELLALAVVGFIVARVALGQTDDRMALAQGLVIGPALWGLLVNFLIHLLPGLAGALAGWVILVGLAAGCVLRQGCRAPRVGWRTLAGFAVAALAVFWAALAVRQMLPLPDTSHAALAATIRAGGSASEFPWNPGVSAPWHHGPSLLMGLLAPQVGPDLAFTIEVLGAYAWLAFVLIVGTALLKHGGRTSLLVLAPLMLTTGAWTLIGFDTLPADILQLPVPLGIPAAGAKSSLVSVYWPHVSLDWPTWYHAPAPNIWKPQFVLGYALAFTVLERATVGLRAGWAAPAILALLIGFLGLVEETLALSVLGCWGLLGAARLSRAWRGRSISGTLMIQTTAGPVLATALLAVGGGAVSDMLTGSLSGGLSLGWPSNPWDRRLIGTIQTLPGGLAMLGLGPLIVGIVAVVSGRFNSLVLSLSAACGVFLLAALILRYTFAPYDLDRFDGHARNFALLALLVALSSKLVTLRPVWRFGTTAVILVLVVWPTVAAPVKTLGLVLGQGAQLSNAVSAPRGAPEEFRMGQRHAIRAATSPQLVSFIRRHTAASARILSPYPHDLTVATGRPNASGFADLLHLNPTFGPEFEDARRYLEPEAIRRLEFEYIHATDAWIASLTERARRWLDDPELFEPLVRADGDTLFRIKPAFLVLDPPPAPQSFEALRQAIPASATVLLTESLQRLTKVKVASVLADARLLGHLDTARLHVITELSTEPSNSLRPEFFVVSRHFPLDATLRRWPTVWWNEDAIALATRPVSGPTLRPPPPSESSETDFAVRLSEVRAAGDSIAFIATFVNQATSQWTGQDWLVFQVEDPSGSWAIGVENDGFTLAGRQWFAGQINPSNSPIDQEYAFDALTGTLATRNTAGSFDPINSAGGDLTPGVWVLAVRLRHDYLQAAIIPVLEVRLSADKDVTYTVYEGEQRSPVNACPERLRHTDSCRNLATGN